MFDLSSFNYKLEQFVSDPEDLKKILQHQLDRQKLAKSNNLLTFGILFQDAQTPDRCFCKSLITI